MGVIALILSLKINEVHAVKVIIGISIWRGHHSDDHCYLCTVTRICGGSLEWQFIPGVRVGLLLWWCCEYLEEME